MSAEDQWWYGLQHQPVSNISVPEVASKLKNWEYWLFYSSFCMLQEKKINY